MELILSLILVLLMLFGVVFYQSRKDTPSANLYIQRFGRLLVLIISYFKDVGVYAARRFKEINWDLSYNRNNDRRTLATNGRSLANIATGRPTNNQNNNTTPPNNNNNQTKGTLDRKKIDES